jgi:hypothetical protein
MTTTDNAPSDKYRAYRRRLAAKGRHQFITSLPCEMVAIIDGLKERNGLRNRDQVLEQIVEIGIERLAAQQ